MLAQFDSDGNDSLSSTEILKLVDWVWSSFHPGGQPLSSEERTAESERLLRRLDANSDGVMDLDLWFMLSRRTETESVLMILPG